MPSLVALHFQKCERCGSEVGLEKAKLVGRVEKIISANFQCPLCLSSFCIDCAKKDFRGDGSCLICPSCKAYLSFR